MRVHNSCRECGQMHNWIGHGNPPRSYRLAILANVVTPYRWSDTRRGGECMDRFALLWDASQLCQSSDICIYLPTRACVDCRARLIELLATKKGKTHSITSFKFMVKLNKLYIDKLNGIEIQICFVFFKYSDIICLWNIFDSKNQKLIKVLVKLSIYAIKIILSVSFNANFKFITVQKYLVNYTHFIQAYHDFFYFSTQVSST